ncbi:unnamed protein product [Gongylonema pulchrum]|uniref:C2H2-type domain-containing protein n=1 Tax=Gongylonema pulchrum TaxID=637853 RepID=A0A183CXV1_9BILA|nr:unnamed protein product [Gongylonema pulchrum]
MSLAAACKLFICFIPLHLAAPNNHSFLSNDAPHQPFSETIPVIFPGRSSYLSRPDASSRNLATDKSDAGFVENFKTDLSSVEKTLCHRQLERTIEEWLKMDIVSSGQSSNTNENVPTQQGVMDFEAVLFAARPGAVQAAATTSDVYSDQSELWKSRFSRDTFKALISRNAQSSGLQAAADLEQLEHIQQEPIASRGTAALRSNPLFTYVAAQLPSDPVDSSRNNRVSGDFSSISSTQVNSKSISTLLQSLTTDKLEPYATSLYSPASGSDVFSMRRLIDQELEPNSFLTTDPCRAEGASDCKTVLNLALIRNSAACNLVSDTSAKYTLNRLPEKKSGGSTLICNNPIPPAVNRVPISNPSVTAPLHFITKQSTSSKKPNKKPTSPEKLTTSRSVPTQTSVRTELTAAAPGGPIHTAQTSNSTKSTNGFTCGRCGKLFFVYVAFKKHLSSHNKEGEYRCNWPDCSILEKSCGRLSRHYLEHLPANDLYLCEVCGKIYNSWRLFTSHKQSVHTKGEFCFRK